MSIKKVLFLSVILCFVNSALGYRVVLVNLDERSEQKLTTEDAVNAEAFTEENPIIEDDHFREDFSKSVVVRKRKAECTENCFNTIALNPREKSKILKGFKGHGLRQPIFVVNVGKGQAEIGRVYQSPLFKWKNIDDKRLIKPGEIQKFSFNEMYLHSALEIRNPSNTRVILYASRWDEESGYSTVKQNYQEPTYNFDDIALKVGKEVIIQGARYVPAVGPALSKIIQVLWPKKKTIDPWVERLKTVKKLINHAKYESIRDNLNRIMAGYRNHIEDVMDKVNRSNIADHYMQLIDRIKSYPYFFACPAAPVEDTSCFLTLPLFTQLINTNMALYNWGIQYADKLRLSNEELCDILTIRQKMVLMAIQYIEKQYEEQIEYTYNTCLSDEYYNSIMEVRSYVALSALEHITHWKNIVDPNSKIDYNVMTYSSFHGMSSPALYIQAVTKFGSEPLTPRLIPSPGEQRRNKLVEIKINYYAGGNEIHGMILTFEEGEPIQLGSPTDTTSEPLKMADRIIESLDVDFSDAIDCFNFHMSDGEKVTFGVCSGMGSKHFELAGHYIASLYVANDIPSFNGALANIAVSYQQKPTEQL